MLGLGNLLSKGKVLGFPNKYSFNFDGSNDYLDCGFLDDFVVTNNISVSLWFNASGIQDFDCFFSQRVDANNLLKAWYHGNNIVFEIYEGGTKAGRRISWTPDSNWHHLVFSFDTSDTIADSKVQIYIDGALPTQTDIGGYGNSGSTESFRIGSASNDNYFTGKIDEFAFWNAVLSASDVAKIGSKPVDFSKASTYATDRTANLKLWLRAGDKVLPESTTSIARADFSADFDGSNDYVDLGSATFLTHSNSFTISAWVKKTGQPSSNKDTNDNPTIISQGNVYFTIFVNYDGMLGVFFYNSSNATIYTIKSADGAISLNTWHHVALAWNSTSSQLYVDGVSVYSGSVTPYNLNTGVNGTAPRIGSHASGGQSYWNGVLSSLSVHKTNLPANDIALMAKSRFTPTRDYMLKQVDFDGSNDYIDCGASSSIISGTNITLACWFKSADTDDSKLMQLKRTSSSSNLSLDVNVGGSAGHVGAVVRHSSGGTVVSADGSVDDGAWHHLALTTTSSAQVLYLDGVSIATGTVALVDQFSADPFTIGTVDGSSYNFGGSMVGVAVYSEAKDADFIYSQYAKGLFADWSADTNLSGYWKMGNGTGDAFSTIVDQSSNSNNGTITNGASDDIVQNMVAGYDLGAFESTGEETLELVTNGDMSSAPTISGVGLTYYNASGALQSDAIGGVSNTYKIILGASESGCNARIRPNDSLLVGELLSVSAKIYNPSGGFANVEVRGINTSGGGISYGGSTTTKDTWITYTGTMTYDGTNADPINVAGSGGSTNDVFYVDDFSVTKVLQSADLSDSYPAIIDVNEPVLGAELVTNGSFETVSDGTHGYDNGDGTVDGYVAINSAVLSIVSNKLKVLRGGTDTKPNALYSFTATSGKTYLASVDYDISNCNSVRFSLDEGDSIVISSGTTGTLTHSFVSASTGSRAIFLRADCDSSEFALFDNFSIKEIQGNVGTMTNQDSADLVYSSVLPDQSFLTGVNSAYNFIDLDGSNEYIAHSNISFTGAFSISSWINLDNVSSGRPIVGDTGNNNWFKVVDADTAGIRIAGGTATEWDAGMTFPTGSWAYVAVVRNASNEIIVYVNGVAYTSNQPTLSGTYVLNALGQKGNGQYFDGKIGQIALYNKALSATEVGAIYTLGRHGNLLDKYSDNLKGYWAMSALDASTGLSDVGNGTIYDRSGQSNHGTATNTEAADLASSPNAEPNGYSKSDTNRSNNTP